MDFKKKCFAGGDAALTDDITADGQNGVSFIHPLGEIFLQPLAGQLVQFMGLL